MAVDWIGGGDGEDLVGVVGGEGEDGNAIKRLAGGDDAGGADEAAGGFEADDVVESSGDTAGAGGVGAEGEGDEAGGDGDGGTGAGAAGNEIWVEDVGDCAVGRAGADEASGELVHVCFADEDCAGIDELLHDGGGCCRGV